PFMTPTSGRPDSANAYLKIASEYPKSSAAARAVLLAGGSLYVDGKYSEARAQFERFRREHSESPFIGEALLGIAACHEAEGKTDDAVRGYKDLVDHHATANVIPQAKFALARLYEAQNKPELARPYFEDLTRTEPPYSSIGSEAGMRLQ